MANISDLIKGETRITAVCTLLKGRVFKTFERLKEEFYFYNSDLYRYLKLKHVYHSEIRKYLSQEGNELIETLIAASKELPQKLY